MSDTPRTDGFHSPDHLACDWSDFARQLERELAAVTAERDKLQRDLIAEERGQDNLRRVIAEVEAERDALREDEAGAVAIVRLAATNADGSVQPYIPSVRGSMINVENILNAAIDRARGAK